MSNIDAGIRKLLLESSIYDSLEPLIQFCEDDTAFIEFLLEINNQFDLLNTFQSYLTIADLIRSHPTDELNITFTPSELQESFRCFVFSWDRLNLKKVPHEEWSDFIKEGISLLRTLIDENKLEKFKEEPRYKDFMKRFIQRHEDLRKSGKYPDLNELMDD